MNPAIGRVHQKLTPADVHEIRRLYFPGELGYKRLAVQFGVDPTAIRDIVKGRTWKKARDLTPEDLE